jgi:NADH:ubiquinone oxidoreductase subunit 4 (subunit M)
MIFLPLFAAVACLFVPANTARWTALLTTLVLFGLGCTLWAHNGSSPNIRRSSAASLGRSASTASR